MTSAAISGTASERRGPASTSEIAVGAAPLLEISDLRVAFRDAEGRETVAVDGGSFTVRGTRTGFFTPRGRSD